MFQIDQTGVFNFLSNASFVMLFLSMTFYWIETAFFKEKKVPVALASSSPLRLIEKLMRHYGIYDQFDLVRSAEFEPYGKPHPAVFITTASKLHINPLRCLVFEDSFNGVLAAKAARMKCVAVPEMRVYNQPRFAIADLKLPSLLEFDAACWEKLNAI